MRSATGGSPGMRSDSPVPRLSNQISRLNEANPRRKRARCGSSQARSRWETKPGMNTRSGGPSPSTWYAMRRPPELAYAISGRTPHSVATARHASRIREGTCGPAQPPPAGDHRATISPQRPPALRRHRMGAPRDLRSSRADRHARTVRQARCDWLLDLVGRAAGFSPPILQIRTGTDLPPWRPDLALGEAGAAYLTDSPFSR